MYVSYTVQDSESLVSGLMWLSPLLLMYAITAPTVGVILDILIWLELLILSTHCELRSKPFWFSESICSIHPCGRPSCLVFNTYSGMPVWCSIHSLGLHTCSGVLYCDWLTWTIHIYLSDQLLYVCSVGDLNCFYIHSMTVLHGGGAVPCTCMCWQCYTVEGPYHLHRCVAGGGIIL